MAKAPTGKSKGRPVCQETRLGRRINELDMRLYEVSGKANINPRLMTEYCAGRKAISDHHLLALCRVLKVEPWQILEDDPEEDANYTDPLTDSAQTVPTPSTGLKTVDDLKREHRAKFPVRKVV